MNEITDSLFAGMGMIMFPTATGTTIMTTTEHNIHSKVELYSNTESV